MWTLLSKERKMLLGVTVIVFLVSATMIWQTYHTLQIYNAADALCTDIKPGAGLADLHSFADANQTPLQEISSDKFRFGFSTTGKESCGCHVHFKNGQISSIEATFCVSSSTY